MNSLYKVKENYVTIEPCDGRDYVRGEEAIAGFLNGERFKGISLGYGDLLLTRSNFLSGLMVCILHNDQRRTTTTKVP